MIRLTGSQPQLGSWSAMMTPDGNDWCIRINIHDEQIERWCSVWHDEPCLGKSRVYAILREYGFTMAGFQTADVLQFRGATNGKV